MTYRLALFALFCLACSTASQDAGTRAQAPLAQVAPAPAVPSEPEQAKELPPAEEAVLTNSVAPAAPVDELGALGDPARSTSLGSVSNGHLEGGVALPLTGTGFRHNARRDESARFATGDVIRAIVKAARVVHDEEPGSELVVNDIGYEHGGAIPHHGSHRAGRDADILFYMLGDDGQPIDAVGAPLDPQGVGFDFKDLSVPDDDVRVHFDAARTWRFVAALLSDGDARVQRIFVVEHLRTLLLQEAERVHASPELMTRFGEVTCQPSIPHDDHLHVRWYCSAKDLARGCQDLPPIYPWHEQELRALSLEPVLAHMVRSKERAPTVSLAQAEKNVRRQRPDAAVFAFLKRRKAWEKQPHPGREYCR